MSRKHDGKDAKVLKCEKDLSTSEWFHCIHLVHDPIHIATSPPQRAHLNGQSLGRKEMHNGVHKKSTIEEDMSEHDKSCKLFSPLNKWSKRINEIQIAPTKRLLTILVPPEKKMTSFSHLPILKNIAQSAYYQEWDTKKCKN
ncbi:hypothetical protein POVCU2_0097730 [Plasmodium ovale curtisi]|uniref:Uncharacterized protein n=1 Tax=Plasmodium ovale curtisi TaxID=864141 RepID=A0A1A8X7Q8_PLAOA|nr:hypothetical protein POVCU2_0097730 [Plasmodium ovale curtisi]SBT01285.1 hypothetical protein POVCU1_065750 [Plasmodium ovale curtisi]